MIIKCKWCGKEFAQKNKNHLCCSEWCRWHFFHSQKTYTYKCVNCGKEYVAHHIKKGKNNYCNIDCEKEYKHKLVYEITNCEMCGNPFEKRRKCKQRFCSIMCQGKWQSIYLVGENSNRYIHSITKEQRTHKCEWCGCIYTSTPKENRRFCNTNCRQEWYRNVWSQQEWWKDKKRIQLFETIKTQNAKRDTKPQQQMNIYLERLGIKYTNEYPVDNYYWIDNYLDDYNLAIEIMGDYWHCSPLMYNRITTLQHRERITVDKRKNTYLLRKGVKILYIWERDVYNATLCESLIIEFIRMNGDMDNYNSFNYTLRDGQLKLNDKIIKPYHEMTTQEINNHIAYKNSTTQSNPR